MSVCAVDNCNGPTLPNLEYCLMHRKNKPTSVPPLPIEVQAAPLNKKSMIVGSIKSSQNEIAKEESMSVCAVNDCDGPCLPNLEYCLMHRKNKPTSVPSQSKSMIVGSIKSNSNQTRIGGLNLVVFIVCFVFLGLLSQQCCVLSLILMLILVYRSTEWKTKDN